MKPIHIVLADDHTLLRAGIRSLLEGLSGMIVVAEAANGLEAWSLVDIHRPDILLTDIAMHGLNGLELAEKVGRERPETKVIVLSMHNDEEYVRRAMAAGARGYLLKDSDTEELGHALRCVARGEAYLSPAVSQSLIASLRKSSIGTLEPTGGLTPRQVEVLRLIAEGLSTKAIARKLELSTKTVEWHRGILMERLGIHDIANLVRYAIRVGIVAADR